MTDETARAAAVAAPHVHPGEKPFSWEDDLVQFARLLCEIRAIQDNFDVAGLCASMDLEESDLDELLDRAHDVWESTKRGMY